MPGFQIQTETLTPAEQGDLKQALDEKFTIAEPGGPGLSLETVGATFGRQVVTASLKAVVIALLLILVYVSFRFQWKFAVGRHRRRDPRPAHRGRRVLAHRARGHDATIAAVLTILGYSLYDTVIIYDRIRENQPKLSRMPYGDMVNRLHLGDPHALHQHDR